MTMHAHARQDLVLILRIAAEAKGIGVTGGMLLGRDVEFIDLSGRCGWNEQHQRYGNRCSYQRHQRNPMGMAQMNNAIARLL